MQMPKGKWVWIAGLAVLGGGAYWYMTKAPAEETETLSDGSTYAYPMTYATAFGGIGANSLGGGSVANVDGIGSLAAAFDAQAANELALGLGSLGVERDLGLAAIKSTELINANNNASDYMAKFLAMAPTLSKLGVSGIGGGYTPNATGGFNIDAGMVYTNPALNLAFASGYNDKGDLVASLPGGKTSILIQDAQSAYDLTKFVDMTGTTMTAPVSTLGSKPTLPKAPKPPRAPRVNRPIPGHGGGINNTGITSPTGMQTSH